MCIARHERTICTHVSCVWCMLVNKFVTDHIWHTGHIWHTNHIWHTGHMYIFCSCCQQGQGISPKCALKQVLYSFFSVSDFCKIGAILQRMESGGSSSPKKSPPQLSPPYTRSPQPYSPNNNSPPDISADFNQLTKDANQNMADSPPKLRREVRSTPPHLSPKFSFPKGTVSSSDEKEMEEKDRFASPTPSVSSKKSTSPCQYSEEMDVLGRWSDGLMYLGTILKVSCYDMPCLLREKQEGMRENCDSLYTKIYLWTLQNLGLTDDLLFLKSRAVF